MLGTSRVVAAFAISLIVGACGTGDTKVDPGDLELRDLLGVAPEVATSWDAEQKSSARHVISVAFDDKASAQPIEIGAYKNDDELVRALATLDAKRLDAGDDALALVRVSGSALTPRRAQIANAELVDALAVANGYTGTSALTVTKEPRLTVAAVYLEGATPRLLVNPVVLTAFDDGGVAIENTARQGAATTSSDDVGRGHGKPTSASGNPYSFYGSVAECAQAQRLRCEACLPSNNCTDAVTKANANDECTMFAANGGRGYYLECINLSLAITSVEQCTADSVGSCARVTTAASDINQLNANADFLDDMACGTGLDGCLAKIYGKPSGTFPTLDGGTTTSDPPRNPDVSCGDSCSSDNNSNCEASPNCSCDGPSCNNSLSCDSTCASSNDQSGCGGGCDSCNKSSDGGGSSGGGCGGSSSGGSSGGGCGGSSSGGGGCGGCSDSGGSSSSGSSGGCGGGCSSSDSSSSSGSSCGGGGGGGGCQVTEREPSAVFAVGFSLGWAFLPVPLAALIRRRSRKQKRDAKQEVQS